MSHYRLPARAVRPVFLASRYFTTNKGNSMQHGDNSRLEDFSHWPSDDELYEAIEEAI